MTLNEMKIGQEAIVIDINSSIKRRLMDIGLIKGTKIKCVLESPFKDPKAYMIRTSVIAIRNEDAKGIAIKCLK